jgi:hypothetical protein
MLTNCDEVALPLGLGARCFDHRAAATTAFICVMKLATNVPLSPFNQGLFYLIEII